ncbi:MAG: beta-N-acetylhexosaminidase [Nitrospiraceae bacterium]
MTRRNQVGQLFMLGFAGTSVSKNLADFLAEYRPGGLILFARNLETPSQIANLTNTLQQRASDLPLLISIDQEGGRVSRLPAGFTIFPACEVIGQCNSFELAYAAASATAVELRAVGINMNLAPVLDVNTNPANPIIGNRSFGTSATLVAELGLATMSGLQDNKVLACGKHFPGHGDTPADSHYELPVVTASLERLRALELRPFLHAIQNGLASMMTAHVLYPALDEHLPATLSPAILTDLLRGQLRFTGLTLTDDLEMHAIMDHHGIEEAAVQAFLAGADMLLIGQDRDRQVGAMEAVLRAVTDGTISKQRLDASLRRLAQAKSRFLQPYTPVELHAVPETVGRSAHNALLDTIRRTSERRAKASV